MEGPVTGLASRARELAAVFYGHLEREVRSPCGHLAPPEADGLANYYRNLLRYAERTPYYRHNWMRRVTTLTEELLAADRALEILDAGCGRGTEAIFFASLDSRITVTGLDCHWPSLRTAQKRTAYYEQALDRPLQVSFHNDDVLAIPAGRVFDVVWLMESISHIHPAEAFVERLPGLLRPGGLIAVSDSNRLNPVMLSVMLRHRLKGLYVSETLLHDTGRVVKMAEERLFTPGMIERRLVSLGLHVKHRILGGFMPPLIGAAPTIMTHLSRLEDLCQKMPGLARLGGIYTLVAEKPARSQR